MQNKDIYYGIDGDKIGRKIETMFIKGEEDNIKQFSKLIEYSINQLEEIIVNSEGIIIFAGGDSILFKGNFSENFCEKLLEKFIEITGCTASMGIGDSLTETFLSMKIAKTFGGGKVFKYNGGNFNA